ncbi:hypothetical protein GQ457_01G014000 [Hibiscus cannabinus]
MANEEENHTSRNRHHPTADGADPGKRSRAVRIPFRRVPTSVSENWTERKLEQAEAITLVALDFWKPGRSSVDGGGTKRAASKLFSRTFEPISEMPTRERKEGLKTRRPMVLVRRNDRRSSGRRWARAAAARVPAKSPLNWEIMGNK